MLTASILFPLLPVALAQEATGLLLQKHALAIILVKQWANQGTADLLILVIFEFGTDPNVIVQVVYEAPYYDNDKEERTD